MSEKEKYHTVNANKGDELNLTSQGPGKNIRTLNANVGSTINFGGDGPSSTIKDGQISKPHQTQSYGVQDSLEEYSIRGPQGDTYLSDNTPQSLD